MEPSSSAESAHASARDPDSSDEENELTDAEYAQLLQEQLSLDEEDGAENPPAAAAPQNDAPGQRIDFPRGMIVFNVGRCFMIFVLLYLSVFAVLKSIVVGVGWSYSCERQLHTWTIVQSVLEVLMVAVKAFSYWRVSQPDFQDAMDQGEMPQTRGAVAAALAFNRFFNFCFFVWWIVGLAFWFGNPCQASPLSKIIATELFLELGVICLIVFLFIVSATILGITYWRRPELFRPPNRGANQEDIQKLKEIVFEKPESMGIQAEDAQCAICLSTYEASDKIRYLPCKHHFHSGCIDEWLLKNKTCPFCKRAIDDKNAVATATTQESAENAV
eukprot:TRINITY_DN13465_c0_g1_i1.p1 TRINITY_DN13465_c0_g1~~TRINITY_DN13465_c0_g1_i1.p1  ORF type:complete len:331 (-),score=56.62 TRINITY_DN13465_c0_g1_i1:39-1031(-)